MLKRLIAITIILCMMLFSFSACAFLDDDADSSSVDSSSSSKESEKEETKKPDKESTSKESEPESTKESTQASTTTTEAEGQTSTPEPTPALTEYGGFSTTITKTAESTDRLRQGSMSRNAYNAGSAYSDSKLSSVLSNAKLVKNGGNMLGYTNASGFIDHFLSNTGTDYTIDMSLFLADQNALANRNSSLGDALRASERLAVKGESVTAFQKSELVHHNLQGDWKFAVGSYFSSIEIRNLTFDGTTYKATFIYKVTDYYNWDSDDANSVFSGIAGALTGNISPKDLHQLHRAGMAKEFLSVGEVSYTVEWTLGQSAFDVFK